MYNLLVSGNDDSWNGEPYILEVSRCVREYTDAEINKTYGEFTSLQVSAIKSFPCIFAYEAGCKKDPKFGLIREVAEKNGKVKIAYEIFKLEKFLSHSDILTMLFELDILDWEMNRTHWAIKDVNLPKELASKGVLLPQWVRSVTKTVDVAKHNFDVALSFPGEVRDYVKSIAEELERIVGPNSYFYDENYVGQLARPSLDNLLQDIYRNRSKLVVVFLCGKYEEKEWCGIEFRAIKDIIMEKQHERIMFVKMDDGNVQGVFKTDGYVDGRVYNPSDIADFIQERLLHLP